MDYQTAKKIFVDRFGEENFNILTPLQLNIIDESIESLVEGTSLLNNKVPESEDEIFYLLIRCLEARQAAFDITVASMLDAYSEYDSVQVEYRGQLFHVKRPR